MDLTRDRVRFSPRIAQRVPTEIHRTAEPTPTSDWTPILQYEDMEVYLTAHLQTLTTEMKKIHKNLVKRTRTVAYFQEKLDTQTCPPNL